MWNAAYYFGDFLGATLAGISVDAYGFRQTTVYFWGLLCASLILDLFELIFTVRTENKQRIQSKGNDNDLPFMTGYEELR